MQAKASLSSQELALDRKYFEDLKHHQTGDIRYFLIPFFFFKASLEYKTGEKKNLWGHEHSCTYSQCKYGRVENILLDRQKGYDDLCAYLKGKEKFLKKYKIYMRMFEGGPTDILCRAWYMGNVELQQDPEIPNQIRNKVLFFHVLNGKVIVTETDPTLEDFKINL